MTDEESQGIVQMGQVERLVAEMWNYCSSISSIQMATAEDTIHFLHEEASEVVKCAMHMGLMGDKTYYRSEESRSADWSYARLIEEVGDVLLMAVTLSVALGLNAGVCLNESMNKFRLRAARQLRQQVEEALG